MELFEAKSDRGLERRVDETELRNLYQAGFLHLDSQVRRSSSPNWFRVDEMFPQFEKLASHQKYSANVQRRAGKNGMRNSLISIFLIVVAIFLLVRFTQKLVGESRGLSTPTTNQSGR